MMCISVPKWAVRERASFTIIAKQKHKSKVITREKPRREKLKWGYDPNIYERNFLQLRIEA